MSGQAGQRRQFDAARLAFYELAQVQGGQAQTGMQTQVPGPQVQAPGAQEQP